MHSHFAHLPVAMLLSAVLAALSGCTGLPAQKHPENRYIAADDKISTDTVNQLARIYPPAKTQFNLVLSHPEGFGMVLADKLRTRGYAVSESAEARKGFYPDGFGVTFQPKPGPRSGPESAFAKTGAVGAGGATGIELRYTLDDARLDPLLRITVKVGSATLARAYLADNGNVAAAGAWTFRGE